MPDKIISFYSPSESWSHQTTWEPEFQRERDLSKHRNCHRKWLKTSSPATDQSVETTTLKGHTWRTGAYSTEPSSDTSPKILPARKTKSLQTKDPARGVCSPSGEWCAPVPFLSSPHFFPPRHCLLNSKAGVSRQLISSWPLNPSLRPLSLTSLWAKAALPRLSCCCCYAKPFSPLSGRPFLSLEDMLISLLLTTFVLPICNSLVCQWDEPSSSNNIGNIVIERVDNRKTSKNEMTIPVNLEKDLHQTGFASTKLCETIVVSSTTMSTLLNLMATFQLSPFLKLLQHGPSELFLFCGTLSWLAGCPIFFIFFPFFPTHCFLFSVSFAADPSSSSWKPTAQFIFSSIHSH